jgi:hypothetical protein
MPTRDRAQFKLTRSAPYEKSKFLGSGGSMVARLKLKGIDGRAPPGVNRAKAVAAPHHKVTCKGRGGCSFVLVRLVGQHVQIAGTS